MRLVIQHKAAQNIMDILRKGAPFGNQNARKDHAKQGNRGAAEKWFNHILTEIELKQFIADARDGKNPGNALLGYVSDSTKQDVKNLTGIEVSKIILEGSSVAHADNPKHHLREDDIEKCAQVINNPISIKLSSKTNEQGLKIIEFKGDIDGIIYFAEAVHKNHGGWLSLASVYRPSESKVSGAPMLPDGPPELTPETPRPMPSNQLLRKSVEKSSGRSKGKILVCRDGMPMMVLLMCKAGMNRSRLHLEIRTDKNGHTVKRWVADARHSCHLGGNRIYGQEK